MFEIGWVELLAVAVVLIVVVGPKDLPGMLRTFGRTTTQLRRMAGDFRRQFDDALREAEIDELRKTAGDIRKLDPTSDIRKAMNPMKAVGDEIRSSLKAATKAPEPRVPGKDEDAQPTVPPETPVTRAPEPEIASVPAMTSVPEPAAAPVMRDPAMEQDRASEKAGASAGGIS